MPESASPPLDSATGKPALAGILLVEDSEHTRRPLASLLRFRGYTVHEAAHGREALDVLERDPNAIRVILLDLAMPVMDGWQFRQAQLHNPLIATIPVVVFTGAPPDAVMDQVLRADMYLQKPVAFDQLMEAIARLFGVT
jgi:CheY-like chemotaxis protein